LDLARDISAGEKVEAELDAMIRRRDDKCRESEGESREREAWQESERRHAAQRQATNRLAWRAFHEGQAARHRAVLESLIAGHEAEAQKYGHNHEEDSSCSTRKAR